MRKIARLFVAVLAIAAILLGQCGVALAQAGGTSLSYDHTTTGYFLDTTHKLVSCESCHTAGVFRGTPRTCAACHAGPGARAPGKPATHIPTTAACDACHRSGASNWAEKPTGFITGASGHAINPLLGVTSTNCQTCHSGAFTGANALTKPEMHIQTAAACSTCHNTTSWLPATNPHAGVLPGSCANCHNGVKTTGKPISHIPTASACDNCHANFTSFARASMNHAGLDGQCATCHSGRYISENAQSKPLTHIVTSPGAQCDSCHHSTTSWATITFDHNTRPAGSKCTDCHNGTTTGLGKPSNHVPTDAAWTCDNCHTNFTAFKPAQMNHSLTAGKCKTCHNGAYVAVNALWQGLSGRHIPTTMECDSCHTNGFLSWSPARMSHAGLDGMCKSCHSGGYLPQNAQTKTTTHIATTEQCDTCHRSTATWATGSFNHASASPAVGGRCSTCHNGTSALGKSTNHIPTAAQCDACHNVTAFASVTMDHAGTAGICSKCHNGNYNFANALSQASAGAKGHIPTTTECDTCHTRFDFWSPAVMNHTGLGGKCSSCHNGTYLQQNAQQKPATHVTTTAQCDACHGSTTSWTTVKYSHDATANGRCNTCHGVTAIGKPVSAHIPTTEQCDSCHKNFTAFKPAAMNHAVATGTACADCHGGAFVSQNALAKPATHIQTSAACDTCHGTGYTTWTAVSFNHSGIGSKACADCHNGVNALGKPLTGHIPTSSGCDSCHKNFTAFKPAKMNHATASGVPCASCHSGSYVPQGALSQSQGHIPATGACDTCHKNSNFLTWAPSAMDHTGLTLCSTCHNGNYLRQNAQAKPTTHQATTAQCSDCHKSTTTWATATQDHSKLSPPVSIGDHTCNSCHNGTPNKGLSKPSTHIPTSAACDNCHKTFSAFSPATMDHTGTAGLCKTCHDGTYLAVNAQAQSASHVSTTAQCDVCHGSTTTWATVSFAHSATAYGQCSSCHNGIQALGKPSGHIPTPISNQQCSDCHKNFVSFKPAQMNHVATVGLCSTCHNATYAAKNAQPKPTAHINVSEQCDACHKSGYLNWTPASMDHTLASVAAKACATCHDGSFVAQNAQTKPSTHQSTSAPCSDCHKTTTTWATATQDHSKLSPPVSIGDHTCATSCHNGTPNKGLSKPTSHIPTSAACDNCHKSFTAFSSVAMDHTGTTGACATCHGGGYTAVHAQAKPATHITTTQSCDVCHATSAWKPTTFSHQGVVAGSCATCHNGTSAKGKNTAHIPTTAACDSCHKNYQAFSSAQMNHTGLAGQCSTCHSGSYLAVNAQIKPATHVATSAQCDTCHSSTTSWATASYVHTATATGTCSNCHGTTALGKPTNHVPTTAQCDTCHGNFTAFKPAQMNHAGTAGKCSWCHGGNYLFANALAKPTGHIPVTDQCDTCHKNGYVTWSPASMDHTLANVVSQGCSTCHGGAYVSQNAQTKPATHVATSAQCSTSGCHSSTTSWAIVSGTPVSHSSFTPAVVIGDHTCATACHNGTPYKGLSKPTTHIPTTAACDNCHKNFTAFSPAVMDHTGTSGACSTCHGGAYTALNAQAKPSTHVVTSQSCDVCHTTTAWKPASYAHGTVAAGSCGTCHNGSTALGKNSTHIPTTAACDNCHKNYVAFTPAQMNHTGLAGQCSTCHNGNYLAVNAQAKSSTHVTTTAQCDTCHSSTTSWATATFTHANPPGVCSTCHNGTTALGKPTNHIPTSAACSNCHKNLIAFKPAQMDHTGLTGQCLTCHSGSYVAANAQAKSAAHIPVTAQCDSCHKNGYTTWSPAAMDHSLSSVSTQGCSTCHGGAYVSQNAQTKPATHVGTSAQCSTSGCHSSTTSWAIVSGTPVSHSSFTPPVVIGDHTCATSCHNGTPYKGLSKPSTHIPTSAACDNCHKNFTAFSPAVMDHTGTAAACANCHNGNYTALNAQAKPSTHIPTTLSCDTCHSTTVWKPTTYNHTGVAPGTCATCHNGTKALGKNATHIPTSAACDSCHKNYTAFAPATMNHTGTAGLCSNCHGVSTYLAVNALGKPANHVSTTAQCDTCHKSTTVWTGPTYTHPATATGTCSNCHNGSVSGAQGKSAAHIPTTAQCDTCHKNYTAFSPASMSHAGTAGKCSTCHNGSYVAQHALGKTTGHIPTAQSCELCHTNFTAFSSAKMSHTATAGQCLTCHSGGYTTQGTLGAQVKSASHIATTGSCDGCHSTTAWIPASFAHTTAQLSGKTCASCHNGTTAMGKPALHIPTSDACSVCHRTGVAWLPLITPYAHTGVAAASCANCHLSSYPGMDYKPTANHVPTTASCDACHLRTNWTTLAVYNHSGAVNCDTCHTGTYAGVVGKSTNHVPTTLAGMLGNRCSYCHSSTTSFTVEKMNHGSMQTGCRTCHNSPKVYDVGSAKTVTIGNHEGSKAGNDCSQSGCHKPLGRKGTPYTSWD